MTIRSTRKYRWASVILAAGTASLLVAGCSPAPDSSPQAGSPTPGSAAPGTPAEVGGDLTYWAGFESTDDESVATFNRLMIDPFTAKYPNVTMNVVPQSEEGLIVKLQTALSAGQGPDFIETGGSAAAIPFGQAGFLADLTDLSAREGWKDKMLPWALDMGVIDGKLAAIPLSYETLVLYYNKTLFEEHGWQPPTDRASLEALAGQMEAAGVIPFTAGNADFKAATEFLISSFLNGVAGPGRIHDALAGTISFTDQGFVDSMQLMVDYFNRGWFAGGVKQYLSTTDPQKYAKLVNGDAAMFISGSWEVPALNEYFGAEGNTSDWAWAPLPPLAPGVPSDVYPLSVGGTMSINAATSNLPAAEAYLAWLFSDTAANWQAVKELGNNPMPVEFDPATVPDGIDPRFTAQFQAISDAAVAKNVGYVTWTSLGGAAEAYVTENADKLLTGDLTPADFCAGLAAANTEDAAAGAVPPLFETAAR